MPFAHADITSGSVRVTSPAQSAVIAGSYDSDGTASGFDVSLRGQANTSCGSGWQSILFTVTGPDPDQEFAVAAPSTTSWSGGPSSPWDTEARRNGVYSIRLDVKEKDTVALACNGAQGSHYVTVKVANPPHTPEWSSSPASASDGTARVTLKWKKNPEVDVLEYHILRTGPDGTRVAAVSAGNPGAQNCSLSSGVFTCDDTSFSSEYTGSYDYRMVAVRERPTYNSNESDPYTCETVNKPCVVSRASESRSASLIAPTPEPTEQPTADPGSPPQTPSTKPKTSSGGGGAVGGTRVGGLSFGGGSASDFYSGTYSNSLPYQPRTLIIGGRNTPSPNAQGYTGDVVSETAPDYRTIMLPVAGGLLAFLGAAHVRRLLFHL